MGEMLATARLLGALAALAAALACGPGDAQAQVAQVAYVDVAVTTLWVRPSRTRPIDRPSLTNPVNMDRWAGRMTTPQRRWLVGRLETQALYGTRVLVVGHDGAWAKIVVPSQSTPRDSRGYPGWVPAGQLTTNTILDQYRPGGSRSS